MIRVAIADDQKLQREGYRLVLGSQADIEVVGEAGNGATLLALVRREETDVVLMDVEMPRVDGLAAAQRVAGDARVIERNGVAPRILMMAAVELDDHLAAAAEAGAFAVLYKDIAPEALLEAVRSAAQAADFGIAQRVED